MSALTLLSLSLLACINYDLKSDRGAPQGADDTGVEVDDTNSADDTGPSTTDDSGDDELPPDAATEALYAHSADTLYSIEPRPPYTMTRVAAFVGSEGITDLAINARGEMYAVSFDAVYRVDPRTAQLTRLADTIASVNALSFLPDGTLMAGGGADMYAIDLTTGAQTPRGQLGDYEFDGDMVGLPDGLVWCAMDDSALVTWEPSTGQVRPVGSTGAGSLFGVGYAEGTLFGFSPTGELLTLDPQTGRGTVVTNRGVSFWGAATNPVRW